MRAIISTEIADKRRVSKNGRETENGRARGIWTLSNEHGQVGQHKIALVLWEIQECSGKKY